MDPDLDEADARAALERLPGLTWRPLRRDDLPDIAEFYAANASGALRLYENLGYQRTASTCIHQLTR